MQNQPDLENLLKQALEQALSESRYYYVSCYLKPALETVQEQKRARNPS
jgi:hypothetical protein